MTGQSAQSHVHGVRLTQYADKPGADQRVGWRRSEIHGVTDVIMSRTKNPWRLRRIALVPVVTLGSLGLS